MRGFLFCLVGLALLSCNGSSEPENVGGANRGGTDQTGNGGKATGGASGLGGDFVGGASPGGGSSGTGTTGGSGGSAAACSNGKCEATEACGDCPKDCGSCNPDAPLLYEPFEFVSPPVTNRTAAELAATNGCFSRPLTSKQARATCVSVTRPITDLISETTTAQHRAGSSSMHFRLRPTPIADWPKNGEEPTHRNEITGTGSAWNYYPDICVDAGCSPVMKNQERWYGFSVLFPKDFVFAPAASAMNLRFLFAQWQHGTTGSPAVALEVIGDKVEVVLVGGTTASIVALERKTVATISRGDWMDFVVRVVWARSGADGGAVEVWHNGAKTYSNTSVQTVYTDKANGGRQKLGLYYWRWKNQVDVATSLAAGITNRELFIDEEREYRGANGYAVVVPRGN